MNRRDRLIARARQGYRLAFSKEPARFFAAPGRVNLIGEHVDYNGGFVLPCAMNRETIVALSPAAEIGGQAFIEAVAIDRGQAKDRFALHEPIEKTTDHWQNLLRGVVFFLKERGGEVLPARLAIAGDLPIGAGLSSSASFAVGIATALAKHSRLRLDPVDIAQIAQDAENHFLGTQCGIMDQMASAAGEADSALLLDCRSLEHMPIPVAKTLSLVIIDSGIRRELAASAFNDRRKECEAAAAHFGVASLRDLTSEALEAGRQGLSNKAYARARHVVSEIARVEPVATALVTGDTAALAQLMRASHVSLRDDFEVSLPQVDRLVDVVAAALGSGPGAMGGVRMTGAGFGGCCVALVRSDEAERVIDAVENDYNPLADIPASAEVYSLTGGAREVTPDQ
ncbi:MAG: galactokinase [Pseudomonadota bacterium]